jgi:hypothetical protein
MFTGSSPRSTRKNNPATPGVGLAGASGSTALRDGNPSSPPIRHLTEVDLARRWQMSERTLQAWRCKKVGPRYFKVGGHVRYRLEDIITYETTQLRHGGW